MLFCVCVCFVCGVCVEREIIHSHHSILSADRVNDLSISKSDQGELDARCVRWLRREAFVCIYLSSVSWSEAWRFLGQARELDIMYIECHGRPMRLRKIYAQGGGFWCSRYSLTVAS